MIVEHISSIDAEFRAMDLAMAEERRNIIFDWTKVMRYKTPQIEDQPPKPEA
jgi:hypothetical protein